MEADDPTLRFATCPFAALLRGGSAVPVPAARPRRSTWLVGILVTLVALLPFVSLAQQQPTPIPAQSGVVSGSSSASCPEVREEEPGGPPTDYAIVVDVSRSMVGDYWIGQDERGNDRWGNDPTRNIFPLVQSAVTGYIDTLQPDSNIVFLPFADGVKPPFPQLYRGAEDPSHNRARNAVTTSVADQGGTWITNAVETAIDELSALQNSTPGKVRYQTLLLYTDGEGNGAGDTVDNVLGGPPSVDQLVQKVQDYRASQPYFFVKVISLGLEIPLMSVLEANGIEVVVEPTGKVSPIREIGLALQNGDLGAVQPGESRDSLLSIASVNETENASVTLSVSAGVNASIPIDLLTEQAAITASGAVIQWSIAADALPQACPYVVYLEVTGDDPEVLFLPARFPVRFNFYSIPVSNADGNPVSNSDHNADRVSDGDIHANCNSKSNSHSDSYGDCNTDTWGHDLAGWQWWEAKGEFDRSGRQANPVDYSGHNRCGARGESNTEEALSFDIRGIRGAHGKFQCAL
jgi:hypothetical protein